MISLDKLNRNMPGLMKFLGIELVSAELDRLEARLTARAELENGSGILHGGAYMSFADYLGGLGTHLNLPKGTGTATIESKTNFFRPTPIGGVVIGVATPIHKGRSTMVWQTQLTDPDGKLLAIVTQTQMVLAPTT